MCDPVIKPRRILAVALVGLAVAVTLGAQVPSRSLVVSTQKWFAWYPGDGGLFIVSPTTGAVTPVTGLGSDLTWVGQSGVGGAGSLLVRPGDGDLIVGEVVQVLQGQPPIQVDLHIITLSGSAVASDVLIPIGLSQSLNPRGISQCALLPNGNILVGTETVPGAPLWIVAPPPPGSTVYTVTPRPVAWPPGSWPAGQPSGFEGLEALALDPGGSTAYVGLWESQDSRVYAVDLGTWQATLMAILPPTSTISSLHCDALGALIASTGQTTAMSNVFSITSGNATPLCAATGIGGLNAMCREETTGRLILGAWGNNALASTIHTLDPTSCFFAPLLPTGQLTAWGLVTGIAWHRGAQVTLGGIPTLGIPLPVQLSSPPNPLGTYVCGLALASTPPIPLSDGRAVPLAWDWLLQLSLDPANPFWGPPAGTLDASGRATVTFMIPQAPWLIGMTFHTALVALNPAASLGIDAISAPVAISL